MISFVCKGGQLLLQYCSLLKGPVISLQHGDPAFRASQAQVSRCPGGLSPRQHGNRTSRSAARNGIPASQELRAIHSLQPVWPFSTSETSDRGKVPQPQRAMFALSSREGRTSLTPNVILMSASSPPWLFSAENTSGKPLMAATAEAVYPRCLRRESICSTANNDGKTKYYALKYRTV